jgi:hypothetical protein
MFIIDAIEEEQVDCRSVLGINTKIYSVRCADCAEREGLSFRHTLISQRMANITYRCHRIHSFSGLS